MNYKQIGQRIRTQRKNKMLTQEQLAGLTGVTLSFIGHIERGTRAVSVETLARLCKALEMDMHYIVFGDFSGSSVNSDLLNDLRELLKRY